MIEKIKFNKRLKVKILIFAIFLLLLIFSNSNYVFAADFEKLGASGWAIGGVGAAVAAVLGFIALIITAVVGLLITLLIWFLIQVAQFNDIINVPIVVDGWVIIRDLCNMFFVLILLVIAFATILRQENYSAKKMLPKLLIMAVLINFSRTIFGLIIDFGQVIMLTFVNSFKGGAGHIIGLFNVDKLLSFSTETPGEFAVDTWATAAAVIMAVIASIITLIVVGVMLAILVVRIVMMWIYTIFSPLIFLGFAFPPLQKYTGKLWEDFIKQVIVGPVLAFFLWLALTTAAKTADIMGSNAATLSGGTQPREMCSGIGAFFCAEEFQKYIIVIGMLMGGMMVSQQMGGAAGSIAGKGLQWAKKTPGALLSGARKTGGWLGRKIESGAISELIANKSINPKTGEVSFKGKPGLRNIANFLYGLELRPTKIVKGIGEGLKKKEEREEIEGKIASAEKLKEGGAMGLIKGLGVSRDLTESLARGFLYSQGFKKAYGIATGTTEKVEMVDSELRTARARHKLLAEDADLEGEEKKTQDNIIQLQEKHDAKDTNPAEKARLFGLITDLKKDLDIIAKLKAAGGDKAQIAKIAKDEKFDDNAVRKFERKLDLITPIQTYYADREREGLVREAQSKIGDIENPEHQVELFRYALANKNKEEAAAIITQATKTGNLNDILYSMRTKEDVKDEFGNVAIKKGEKFTNSAAGLDAFFNQVMMEELGMGGQAALAIQSELSSIEKSKGNWSTAETVSVRNGRLRQRSLSEQVAWSRGEARKVDVETRTRKDNRKAWGDETEDDAGNRHFKYNKIGLQTIIEDAGNIYKEIAGKRLNVNKAKNAVEDKDVLLKFVAELAAQGQEKFINLKADGKTEEVTYKELADAIIQYGQNAAKAEAAKGTGAGGLSAIEMAVRNTLKKPTP